MTNTMTKVFVYGSLKSGFHNSRFLAHSQLLGEGRTVEAGFAMLSFGAYPAVIRSEENPVAITGEVYNVSPNVLADLDWIERHPYAYRREEIEIEGHGLCWMYIYQQRFPAPRIEGGTWELPE